MKTSGPMRKADAEALGFAVLSFLAQERDRLERFLALTGLEPTHLATHASRPEMLRALIEHVQGDESLLLTFSAEHGSDPLALERARRVLGAGD